MTRKPPPETSKITRSNSVAYARKSKDGEPVDESAKAKILDADTVISAVAPPGEPPAMPDDSSRARADTVAMPVLKPLGAPPELPTHQAAAVRSAVSVEDPTHMPGPRNIPGGVPDDAAPAPGRVPAGDSRSLRRGREFALIYRQATFVISRCGRVGVRGVWRVVEYPTPLAASHAYAKECSRFVSEGFSDYRE
jgi:hypothetical protein